MQLFFTMTPIIWTTDLLTGGAPGSAEAIVEFLAKLNPFYHFIEIFRAPLVGQAQSWTHWAVVGVITVVGLVARADRAAQLPLPRRVLGVRQLMVSIEVRGACVEFPIFDAKTRSLKKSVLGPRRRAHQRRRRSRWSRPCATST